ncbi:LOW QUALITY PROTEIN: hypothetical protein PRUPE_1G016700 [Prunus persica]|uniref:N-acetyltransferase domain-containing protein n=1 Tax=Prunus persica TaxID=3760 RepID=A0A251QR66_PRUPE|nr:LOW QUALITY PROTEIN: hypothetical protein PRUPE_1G016700 [Prunus persica]
MEGSSDIDLSKISLRPLGLADIDDFMVWGTDEKVAIFCTWEPYATKEEALNYIKEKILPQTPGSGQSALTTGQLVPFCSNSGSDRCRGELGYVLGSKYWGKGIATQAVKLVADTIFKEWTHLERLEAFVDVDNVGSQRVLEKSGFLREGVLRKFFILKGRTRDMVIFSLLSTECEA